MLKHDQQGNMNKSVTFGSYEDIIHWAITLIADKKWVTIFQWNNIVCHKRNYFCSYPTTLFVSHSASVLPDCTDFHMSCCCSGCDVWALFSSLAFGSNLWNAVTRPASPPLALDCCTVSDKDRWWLWCSGVWHLEDGDGGGVHLQHHKHTTLKTETRDVLRTLVHLEYFAKTCLCTEGSIARMFNQMQTIKVPGSSDTAPHILDLGTWSKCVVGLTAQPLRLPQKMPHVLIICNVGWTPETVWVLESAENSLAPD